MAKLILSLDGVVLREIKLDRDTTRIGRKPFNELQIDNLAVSGEHARLSLIGGGVLCLVLAAVGWRLTRSVARRTGGAVT